MDKKDIPKGDYCYTITSIDTSGHMKVKYCPYWKNRLEIDDKIVNSQNYGYCLFLNKGDLELNKELKYTPMLKLDNFTINTDEQQTADEIGLPLSLLWDGVKMCCENMEYDEQEA